MDFGLSESQKILRNNARSFLSSECPSSCVKDMIASEKGYSPELWSKMADLGWQGMIFPSEYGGASAPFSDNMVLFEEMGRLVLPSPFLWTVISGLCIVEEGTEQQKQEYLPGIARGSCIFTMGLVEQSIDYFSGTYRQECTSLVTRDGKKYIIEGTRVFVPYGHIADYVIVPAKTEKGVGVKQGITLLMVGTKGQGFSYTPVETIGLTKYCEVTFDNISMQDENKLGPLGKGWGVYDGVLRKGAVAKCAEMVGGAQQALDMTVNYAQQRVQFDRPLASFQVIQHHCVDMLIDVEASRWLTYQAAWRIDAGLPYAREVAMAKGWVSESYRRVTQMAHQVHGGVGFTLDHDLPLYFCASRESEFILGYADFQMHAVAQQVLG